MGSLVTKRFSGDLLELPDYLSQQVKNGLYIKKISSAWLIFEQSEPADLEYKIVPVNNSGELDHLKALAGWTAVLTVGEFVLICAQPGTPFNMVLDNDIMLVKLSFMRTMYVVRFLLATLGLVFSILGIFEYSTRIPWLSVFAGILSALLIIFGMLELFPLIRLQKSMRRLAKSKED